MVRNTASHRRAAHPCTLVGGAIIRVVAVLGLTLFPAKQIVAQSIEYPQPNSRENIGDWVLECYDLPLGQCQIYQRILINNGAAAAMVTTFAWDEPAQAFRTQIALPLGIALSKGATISSDSGVSVSVPISRCTQQGCLVEGVASDDLVSGLEKSRSANVTVVDGTGADFAIPVSLDGFSEALARLRPGDESAIDENLSPVTGN